MSTSGELPVGTVTFLFTDIEGSTQLLKQLGGERYGEALAQHQQILREAFAEHAGTRGAIPGSKHTPRDSPPLGGGRAGGR